MSKRPAKYPRHRTHPAIMGVGGNNKPNRVINRGRLMEYVGIGWVEVRTARPSDYKRFRELTDS